MSAPSEAEHGGAIEPRPEHVTHGRALRLLVLGAAAAIALVVVGTGCLVAELRARLVAVAVPITQAQALTAWRTQAGFLALVAVAMIIVLAGAVALVARQLKSDALIARIKAEKAELERARALAEAALLKQERLSVLGQMTATVAHELRNPLSAIRNTVYAIRAALDGKDLDLARPMERIERSILRCDHIITDLLDYSHVREVNRLPVRLDAWLAKTLEEQRPPADIVLVCRLAAPTAVVALDSERFRRVIINLVENACQAIGQSEDALPQRTISVATLATSMAEIVIEDSGPGIDPAILPRIFEPLFSTKRFGTGLGLPTVRQIVEQHGGTIDITSERGCGTSVQIKLPLAIEQQEAA